MLENPSPRIVMITTFNDYNEDSAIFPTDTSGCDNSYEEQWYDETGELNASLYFDITCEAIQKLRKKNGDCL